MASPSRSEREEARRLNMRTLTIASAASAAAATVTSQLWIAGTWIAAAATPVIVALVSEALHRPTEKLARAWTTEGPALGIGQRRAGARTASPELDPPLADASGAAPPPPPEADRLPARAPSDAAPVRIYRQPGAGAGRLPGTSAGRRRIALGLVAATAAIAFVITLVTITAGELIAGGSLAGGDRKTTFAGGDKRPADERSDDRQEQPGDGEPATTDEESEESEEPPADEAVPEETTPTAPADEDAPVEQPPPVEGTPEGTPTVP